MKERGRWALMMAFGRVALARFRHLAKFIPAASGGGQARAFLLFSFTCD
jgi:hypothetical protein